MVAKLKNIIPQGIRRRIPHSVKQLIWFLFPPKFAAIRVVLWQSILRYLSEPGDLKLERIGSDYGGWYIPVDLIRSDWICYCGGVGEDITFDLGLIEQFSCEVFAFDPTPRSITYVERTAPDNPNYHFYPYGLWSSNKQMKFYAPDNPEHVSHSVLNLQATSDYFVADCKRLSTIMQELGHDGIDLLKLDIEGAEYQVLNSIIEDNLQIKVICVEFDQTFSTFSLNSIRTFIDPIRTVWQLKKLRYQLVFIDNLNCILIHQDAVKENVS